MYMEEHYSCASQRPKTKLTNWYYFSGETMFVNTCKIKKQAYNVT